ncbi:hypothetical protein JCM33374_g683 [Metschnikowia sp. JCM 33374]|nr:hypothetical protein JCM33374_g683 [Metschnikowia sp. JCM 33374]
MDKTASNQQKKNLFAVNPVSQDFQWDQQKPLKSYPFKDKEYKLNMGIRNIDSSEWLLIENSYLKRIEEKTKITTNNHPAYVGDKDLKKSTIFISPEADESIREFYDTVIVYMCDKYPMYFQKKEDSVYNYITNESVPANSSSVKETRELLDYLIRTIEEDFIILLKDPTRKDQPYGDEYFFKAGVFGFAAGFDPLEKFDQPLTLIHGPIPGYESKLKLSMNRFFDRLKPGDFVSRSNFSIQTHGKFYVDNENKGYHLTEEELNTPIPFEDLDFQNQVHYRSERQVLIKLPKTQATVFTIRTYLHPMSHFNEDTEAALRLRGSLEKFPDDMARYKNITQPRPAVIRYINELVA